MLGNTLENAIASLAELARPSLFSRVSQHTARNRLRFESHFYSLFFSVFTSSRSSKSLGKLAVLPCLDILRLADGSGLDEPIRRVLGRVYSNRRVGSGLTCSLSLLAGGCLGDGLSTVGGLDLDVRGGLAHTLGLGLAEHNVTGRGLLASGRRLGHGALVGRVSCGSLFLTTAQTSGGTTVIDRGLVVELLFKL